MNTDSYLLGLSSDRNLNDYLVELFVERLFAVHNLNQELDCVRYTLKYVLRVFTVSESKGKGGFA